MKKSTKEGLGVIDLFTMGFGAMIGVGWSATLNNLYKNGGGPIPAALGFLLATIVFIPVALCFAELTPALPLSGGIVVYAKRAFNDKVAFIAGWFLSMAYISILPWEAIAINDIVAYLIPSIKSGIVLYSIAGVDIYLNTIILGIALSLAVILLNWRGVKDASRFQNIMAFFLIGGSFILILFAFIKADFNNLSPIYAPMEGKSHSSFIGGVLTMFAMAPTYFSGFDTIPQSAEEAKSVKPSSLGKVIIGALLSAGIFYVIIFIASGLAYPWTETINFSRPVLSNLFLKLYGGGIGKFLFILCIVATLSGLLTTWNSFYIAGSRLLFGMAKTESIPKVFAKEHPKYKTPYISNIFCSIAMILGPFLGAGVLDYLTILGSTGFVIGWTIACLSAARLRVTEPNMNRPYRMVGGIKTAKIGTFLCVLMLSNCIIPEMPGYMGTGGIVALVIWSIIGIVFYTYQSRRLLK